jgi:hypothetical protein
MSKATYMYGQEAQGAIIEREPYWDYMARRGAGKIKIATSPENIVNKHSNVADMVHHSRDMVNHPSHYNKGIETSEYIKSWEMNWNQANVVKYVTRYNLKSKDINIQIQDLMKAKWYLEDLIKELEERNPY